jgi:uncharacterized protein (TIGR02145 family)
MQRKLAIVLAIISLSTMSNAQIKTATVTDSRDNKVYKTIELAGKVWMDVNLDYVSRNSWCFLNIEQNCVKYGRTYSWFAVMNGQNHEKTQGICMSGWHVPSIDEWNLIINQYKKSKDLSIGGVSGFNMPYAGCRFSNASFDFENKAATYWTSTSDTSNSEFATSIYGYSDQKNSPLKSYQSGKSYGLYVRCVKN